jgi:hypothetical protein
MDKVQKYNSFNVCLLVDPNSNGKSNVIGVVASVFWRPPVRIPIQIPAYDLLRFLQKTRLRAGRPEFSSLLWQ